jgi:hypothetical protein
MLFVESGFLQVVIHFVSIPVCKIFTLSWAIYCRLKISDKGTVANTRTPKDLLCDSLHATLLH